MTQGFAFRLCRWCWIAAWCALLSADPVQAQPGNAAPPSATKTPDTKATTEVPPEPPAAKVDVAPLATDQQIQERLQDILIATMWFESPSVAVREGVAFLAGRTRTEQHKKWAGDLARSTEDVVAVVNQIELIEPSLWDFSPAIAGLDDIWRGFVRGLPWIVFSIVVLFLAWLASRLARRVVRSALSGRVQNTLLRNVISVFTSLLVFLGGVYLVLRVAGLTQLAFTVLGGTGVVGIALGIGFRDITENFLASILLSLQNPFRTGDLVEIAGSIGYVQRMTIRSTVLMTLQGNQIQIPNSTVYKATILNYTSTPNRREDFSVGIAYDIAISFAQEVALKVLAEHPAVLKEPEPSVLVDSLGSATVNLKIYFWLNGQEHSWLKVKSAVIRLVKRAFQDHGVTMPDEARERFFPSGIPVRLLEASAAESTNVAAPPTTPDVPTAAPEAIASAAEGGLVSDAAELEHQAAKSKLPDAGDNLLKAPD